jgi:nitrate/nitrite-specific signal transduction histidine kinase
LEACAARITTCLEVKSLVKLLTNEVLPSLSVRQSAILLLEEPGEVARFLIYGLRDPDVPKKGAVVALLADPGDERFVFGEEGGRGMPVWVRLALPLHFGGKTMGLWLMGRRDPDDLYSRAELPLFQALADQIAVALTNLRHTENLRALYREDIDQHEAEMSRLARVLHDEVLNELAVLALFADQEAHPEFQEAYTVLAGRVRQTIGGLRSAMLPYGLRAALHDLADELGDRFGSEPRIVTFLPATETRYPERVEQHLFRIVQQALENALRHAQAQTIQTRGSLEPGRVELSVDDNGVGFHAGQQLDLASLLANKHFGLAGMYERAALIGAQLEITSALGEGTRVSVSWREDAWQALPG